MKWSIWPHITLVLGITTALVTGGITSAIQAQEGLSGSQGKTLLQDYQKALQALPPLPNLQFRQQVRVSGTQDFVATLDVLYRQDQSWQAWLAEGDRIRLIDSQKLSIVNQSDLLELYSVYVEDPETLLPSVGLRLQTSPGEYQVKSLTEEILGDKPVYRLGLEGGGQLRELWLDQETKLPHQALFFLSGVWGQAYALMQLGPVEDSYWLPQKTQINLGYGFWVLQGLSRRTFRGSLTLQHEYQDYKVLPEGIPLRFLPSRPPVDAPPTVAGVTQSQVELAQIESLGTNAEGKEEFSIGLSSQSKDKVLLGDRITAFNLTRPASRDSLTEFDTVALLQVGLGSLPLYLFQFDTETPLYPIKPVNPTQNNPEDVFVDPPATIQLFGN